MGELKLVSQDFSVDFTGIMHREDRGRIRELKEETGVRHT